MTDPAPLVLLRFGPDSGLGAQALQSPGVPLQAVIGAKGETGDVTPALLGALANAEAAASTALGAATFAETKATATALDALATAADRVQTGLDRIAAAASAVEAATKLADLGTKPADGYGSAFQRIDGLQRNFTGANPKNLYDPSLAVDGQLYNYVGGGQAAFATSIVTGKIPVTAGKTYTLWQKSPEKGFFPFLYAWDSAGAYLGMNAQPSGATPPVVSGLSVVTQDAGGAGGYRRLVVTVPAGVAFIGTMALYNYAAHITADFDRIRQSIQLEEGSSATSFEAYRSYPSFTLNDAAVPATIERKSVTNPLVSAFSVAAQRNLYDKSQAVDGQLTSLGTGTNSAYANGMAFGKFPVAESKTYCLWMGDSLGFAPSGNKPLYCYDANGVFLGLDAAVGANPAAATPPTGVVWTGITQVVFTIPVGSNVRFIGAMATYSVHTTDDFNRVVGSIQAEEGSAPSAYQPYSPSGFATLKPDRLPSMVDTRARPMPPVRLTLASNVLYIRTPWDATYDMIQRVNLTNTTAASGFSGNDIVNTQGARKALKSVTDNNAAWSSGTVLQSSGDDACPLNYNGTYIGGNHGAAIVREVTATGHGKAVVDVGSEWTDGASVKWYLMRIVDANKLWFVSQNNSATPQWSFTSAVTGNLTHSAGATNAGAITVGSWVGTQLWPSVRPISRKIYLDGITEMTVDGEAICNFVDIVEQYDILSPAAVVTYVRSQVGGASQPAFNGATIAADVFRTITYRFSENGSGTVTDAPMFLNALTIGYIGGTQAGALTYTGRQLWQYIPRVSGKVGSVKTWNFQAQEQIDGTVEQVNMTSDVWTDANTPPDRMAQIVKTAGVAEFGLMIGYSPVRSVGLPSLRKTLVNDACFMSNLRKQYLKAVNLGAITVGTCFEIVSFRAFWPASANADATCFTWYRDGKAVIVMADFHKTVSFGALVLPPQFNGMDVSVVDKSASVTVHGNGVVAPSGIRISSSGTYGYAVLKLT